MLKTYLSRRAMLLMALFPTIFVGIFGRRQIFPSEGLTLSQCNGDDDCIGARKCIFEAQGRLYECKKDFLRECLCVPMAFIECQTSLQCATGERCISATQSVQICVSCSAANNVQSFASIDERSIADCGSYSDTDYTSTPTHSDYPTNSQDRSTTPEFNTHSPDFSFEAPYPSQSFAVPTESEGFTRGYALDSCGGEEDCAEKYSCRVQNQPLKKYNSTDAFERNGVCSTNDPKSCYHIDECLFAEYCVSGLDFKSSTFGVCVSKYVVEKASFYYLNIMYFPPESNPNPSPESSPLLSPTIGDHFSPEYSPTYTPMFTVSSDLGDPTVPFSSLGLATVFSSETPSDFSFEASASVGPDLYNYHSGLTLDRCWNTYYCRGKRNCVDFFDLKLIGSRCHSQCYCLPPKLQSCTSSNMCERFELCAKLVSTEYYCVSEDFLRGNSYFEVLPTQTDSFYSEPSLTAIETPFIGTPEPRYIPPGIPTITMEPSFNYEFEGMSLDTCTSDKDCVSGYACVATVYAPCSTGLGKCFCVANNGNGGIVCLGNDDCPLGETCYPLKRIDIVPTYCVSTRMIEKRLQDVQDHFSVIVPRGVGAENRKDGSRDWIIPRNVPNRSGTGSGLTGDMCTSSADCSRARLCADALENGEVCGGLKNCTRGYCYPKYFEACDITNLCDEGEVCVEAYGVFKDVYQTEYLRKYGIQKMCLSLNAAKRNGYKSLQVPTPLPKTFVGAGVWKNAEMIIKLKLEGQMVIDTDSYVY